ncbi:MAG TPA: serine hydrolase [Symbiobacteriaceae bacterium]|nr:serine hydrolase [Symbiobacteriaceae bacterium]
MADLQRALEQYRSTRKARYGIYLEDLHSGLTIDLDGQQPFAAAGAMTFPVALYAFALASAGQLSLETQVEYLPEDRTGGTSVIQAAPFGSRYTVKQLCYHAVVDSDTVAWRMLYRVLGEPAVKEWLRSIGGRHAVSGTNLASPADFALYCKYLLEFTDRQPGLAGTLVEWLKKAGNPTWAPRSLPRAVVMAHKTGLWPTALTDCGIVFLPRQPYLLCIMSDLTREISLGQAVDDLARFGAIAFQTLRPLAGTFVAAYRNSRRIRTRLPVALCAGQIMIGADDLADAIGAQTHVDGCSGATTLTRDAHTVHLSPEKASISVCGEQRSLPRAPSHFEGQLIVPLRATAEALGVRVDWDPERYRVLLTV